MWLHTQQIFENIHWETIKLSPYTPELSTCDYHLFGTPNKALESEKFENIQILAYSTSL